MKKVFRKLLLIGLILTMAFCFSACGDDDDDDTTNVTQADIEKYLVASNWSKIWTIANPDWGRYEFYFSSEDLDDNGNNGDLHIREYGGTHVMGGADFHYTISDNKILIDVETENEDGIYTQTYEWIVLSIDSKKMKIRGNIPMVETPEIATYTLTAEGLGETIERKKDRNID